MIPEEPQNPEVNKIIKLLAQWTANVKAEQEEEATRAVSDMEMQSLSLCEDLNSRSFNKELWIDKVKTFADEPTNRLIYSIISYFVFKLEKDDRLVSNIKDVTKDILSAPDGKYALSTKKMVIKLYDHINLAIQQKNLFKQDEQKLRERVEKIVKPEIEEKSSALTKEMTTQLVSLIAIFTALSFIVFGGISSLDSIFQSLQCVMMEKNTILPTLIVAVAWALCLMNLLFGFMYFVLRITKLHSSEGAKESSNIVQRYPVVFLCDLVLVFLLILFGGMWFAELHGIGKPVFDFVVKHNVVSFWIPIIILLLLFRYAVCKLYEAYFGPAETKCFICKKIREMISGKSNTANTDTQKP